MIRELTELVIIPISDVLQITKDVLTIIPIPGIKICFDVVNMGRHVIGVVYLGTVYLIEDVGGAVNVILSKVFGV